MYAGVYKAQVVKIQNDGRVIAYLPQLFGEVLVTITQFTGSTPLESQQGWVVFQSGDPEFPVWISGGGAPGSPGNSYQHAFFVEEYGTLAAAVTAAEEDANGGTVYLTPGSETVNTTVEVNDPKVSIQGYGAFVSTLVAGSGLNGPVIRYRPSTFTVNNAGSVSDFNIIGNSQANGAGIEAGDVIGLTVSGVVITGFTGTSGRGLYLLNSTNWTERGRFIDISILDCTYGIDLAVTGGTDSFGYNRWENIRFNVDAVAPAATPRVGFRVGAGLTLYHCYIETTMNIGGDQGGGLSVVPTGMEVDGTITASDLFIYGEQGVGTGAVGLDITASGEVLTDGMIALSAGGLDSVVDGRLAIGGWCDLGSDVSFVSGVSHPSGEDSTSFRIGREKVDGSTPEFTLNQLSTDTDLVVSSYDGTTFKNFLQFDQAAHMIETKCKMIAQQQLILRETDTTSGSSPEFRFSMEEDGEQVFVYSFDGASTFTDFLKLRADTQDIQFMPPVQFDSHVKINGEATLFSGSGVPSGGTGSNGDWYFRTDGSLYAKKSGAWVEVTQPSDWTNLTTGFGTNWVANGLVPPAYSIEMGGKVVRLRGYVTTNQARTGFSTMLTLPAGCPDPALTSVNIQGTSAASPAQVAISNSGVVTCDVTTHNLASSAWVSLDGITYETA